MATDAAAPPRATRRRFALGIRAQLLLVLSVFLVLPWLGYEYVRELERTVASEREQREALERAHEQAQLRLDDLERERRTVDSEQQDQIAAAQAAADQARTHAATTHVEVEQARERAEQLQLELERVQSELRRLRATSTEDGASSAIGWSATAQRDFSASLLSASEMKDYFSDSKIVFERFGGVPKSMIAVR